MRNQALRPAADPGLAGEIGEGDVVTAARQAVAPRKHGPEAVVEQVDAVVVARADLGKCLVIVDDRQVELAVVEPGQQALQVIIYHGERHVGMLTLKPGQRRRDERGQGGREAAEAQPAVPSPGYLAEFLLGAADPGDQRARVPHEGEPGVGQMDRARAAFDQRQVHRPFQCRDVLAHC